MKNITSPAPFQSAMKKGPGASKIVVPKDVEFRITVDTLKDRFSARVDGVDDPVTDVPTLTGPAGQSAW